VVHHTAIKDVFLTLKMLHKHCFLRCHEFWPLCWPCR